MPDTLTLEQALAALDPATQAQVRQTLAVGAQIRNIAAADPDSVRSLEQIADKALKKANPAYQTLEDRAQPIVDRIMAEVDKKIGERDKKTGEDAIVAKLNEQIADAKANHGFTDEGVANILAMMKDKGIADFDTAMKAYRYDNPAPNAPTTAAESMYWNVDRQMQSGDAKNFFFREGFPTITENPEMWEKETALAYLNGNVTLPTS